MQFTGKLSKYAFLKSLNEIPTQYKTFFFYLGYFLIILTALR